MQLAQLDEESIRTLIEETGVKSFLCKLKEDDGTLTYFVSTPFKPCFDDDVLWFDDSKDTRCFHFSELEAVYEILEDWE